jgi:hypothetical protein
MAGVPKTNTLLQAVPALGSISAQGAGRAKLMPVGFEHPGFELVDGVNRIGRDPGQNHHVILSSHVSRCHCEVLVSGGTFWVRDLASHNGTWINGEKITEKEIKPGDALGLSRRVTLMLVMDQELQKPIGVMMNMSAPAAGAPLHPSPPIAVSVPPGEPLPLMTAPEPLEAVPQQQPAVPPVGSSSGLGFVVSGPTTHPPAVAGVIDSSAPAASAPALALEPARPVDLYSSVVGVEDKEPDAATQLRELEQQRNVLAILYQISLRCLMADSGREAEKLIANVLQRLVPLESGFILYQTKAGWRASICPSSKGRPADQTVQACYDLALKQRAPLVVEGAAELASLGLTGIRSAMVVPLLLNDTVTGVIGIIAEPQGVYTASLVDIVVQLANISAAALRER